MSCRFCLVLAFPLVLALGLSPAQEVKNLQKQSDPRAKVDELLKKWDRSDAPGCVVAVLKDGQIVYQHAGGAASLEFGVPLTLSTLFLIASLSKQFTAFVIMLLVSGGRLSLDDDVRKHLPELPHHGKTITVRHLLHHTSGLREITVLSEYAGWRQDDAMTEKDFIDLVCRQKELNFEPGAEFTYCNTGYHLLGLLVKRVTGKSLQEYSQEEIFKPLGMKNTLFRDDYRAVILHAAESYAPKLGGFNRSFVLHGLAGATNLHTTAADLALWDGNFYDAKVGGKKVIDAMYTKGKLNSGKEIAYAGGLGIGKYRGLISVKHTGGHGGFRTVLLRFPEQHFSVIALANAADFNTRTAEKIADIYLEDMLEPVKDAETKEVKIDTKVLDRCVGQYSISTSPFGPFTVTIGRDGDKLFAQALFGKHTLSALSETEFLAKQIDLRFTFVKADKGEGLHLKISGSSPLGDVDVTGKPSQKTELSADQMKELTGDFYSEELDVIYHISVKDGKIMLRHRKGEAELRPLSSDKFDCDFGGASSVEYQRSAEKRVIGFVIGNAQCRNVRFVRAVLGPSQP
jgi:CubicO group peptidase (beta-lactamase class C family)